MPKTKQSNKSIAAIHAQWIKTRSEKTLSELFTALFQPALPVRHGDFLSIELKNALDDCLLLYGLFHSFVTPTYGKKVVLEIFERSRMVTDIESFTFQVQRLYRIFPHKTEKVIASDLQRWITTVPCPECGHPIKKKALQK